MTELKPCPFCGNDDQALFMIPHEGMRTSLTRYAYCIKCLSRGPIKRSEKEAIEAWNIRKVPLDLKIAKHNEESTERQIKEYLSNPDTRVWVSHNNETGEWLYSVQVYGTDFWLDSFKTEEQASEYIKKHNLIVI